MSNRLEGAENIEKAMELGYLPNDQEGDSQKTLEKKAADRNAWPEKFNSWKANIERFIHELKQNKERQLFSKDPAERANQYLRFADNFHKALLVLSKEEGDYDFYDKAIPYMLGHCKAAWDATASQLENRTNPQESNGDLFSTGAQITKRLRKDVLINRVLPAAIRCFNPTLNEDMISALTSDVHYQKVLIQWANEKYHLGFSSFELGEKEPLLDFLSPHLEAVAPALMAKFYNPTAVIEEFKQFYGTLDEVGKQAILGPLLEIYQDTLSTDPTLYIDTGDDLRALYKSLAETENIDIFEKYSARLKEIRYQFLEKGIPPPFNAKTAKESCLAQLKSSSLARASGKNNWKEELTKLLSKKAITPAQKKDLDALILAYESSDSEESKTNWMQTQKLRIQEVLANLDTRIVLENVRLLKKHCETPKQTLTTFGAAFLGSFSKVLKPFLDQGADVPSRIINQMAEAPLPCKLLSNLSEKLLRDPGLYLILPESLKNSSEIQDLVAKQPYIGCGVSQKEYEEVFIKINQDPLVFDHLSKAFLKDRTIVLAGVKKTGIALKYAAEHLKKDREIVLTAVRNCGSALQDVDESLKNDREIVLAAVTQNPSALNYASAEFKNDRELVLQAVSRNGNVLECVSERLKNDKEIVLTAIKQNGSALRYASASLKNDEDVLLAAVSQNGLALHLIDLRYPVKNLANFFFPFLSSKITKRIVLAAVRENGLALQYATDSLKNDKEIVLAAVRQKGGSLKFARYQNEEIVLAAVTQNGLSLEHANYFLKDNRNIVLAAIKQNKQAIKYASESLQKSVSIIAAAEE